MHAHWRCATVTGGGLDSRAEARPLLGREAGGALRGQASLRTWLVAGYLVALHVLVMLSFSRRHDACLAPGRMLPGT